MPMAKKRQQKQKSGNAVIYARYSSHNQREASLEQQIEACKKYAERFDLTVTDIYQDAAISGKTDDRPAFKRMMKDAEKEKFDYIIAWKSNRIGRNMTQAMVNMARLAEYGIECLYVEEDFDNTASGRFALRNMMNVNEFYSEAMAEDVRRGMMDNAKKCMVNGRVPYGYRKGPDGKYAIDEDRAEVVKQIFDRISSGWTIADIRDDLNNRGIMTSIGKPWSIQSFWKLLSYEQYIGVYKFGDIRIEGGVPAIVDRETWNEVQRILSNKNRPRGHKRNDTEYFLVGKAFCGLCGSPMTGISGTSRNGSLYSYYMCNAHHYDHTCEKKNVPRDDLEYSVALVVKQVLQDDSVIEWLLSGYADVVERIKEESKVNQLEIQLAETNKILGNLMKAMEQGLFNDMAIQRMNELSDTKKDIERALSMESEALRTYSLDKFRATLYSYRDGDLEDPKVMKALIQTFVERVLVFDDAVKVHFNYGDEAESPITKRDDSSVVRDGSTKPHHNIISRTTMYVGFFEIIAPIRKRGSGPG